MALIIRLNNEALASQDEPDSDELSSQHSAEVILFPGVRYERWEDAQSQPESGQPSHDGHSKQGTGRDWLEI